MRRRSGAMKYFRILLICAVVGVTAPVSVKVFALASEDMGGFVQKAAMISAMVNMPQGTAELLERAFSGEVSKAGTISDPKSAVSSSDSDVLYNSEQEEETAITENSPETKATNRPSPAPLSPPSEKPDIPQEFSGTLLQETLSGYDNTGFIKFGNGYIKNYTELTADAIEEILADPMELALEETEEPQVLIVHTHATEAYEPFDSEIYDMRNNWRSTDNNKNMVAVGEVLAQTLRKSGIGVIHDDTQHDYPSYNGSYERSAKTIQKTLDKNPSIKIVLDVHRDAVQREEDVIVKAVTEIEEKKAAQLMIISGSDDGTMNIPEWRSNLRFAASLQDQIETMYPDLTRPIFFCYRKYNMDLSTGSLLLEFGTQANTLEENLYTAELVGNALSELIKSTYPQ